MDISVDDELRQIENSLRDNISFILKDKYGDEWIKHLGVSDDRIKAWKEKMEEENRRLNGRNLDDRPLYYSDFYDLKTIITNAENWSQVFLEVFHNKKRLEYMLDMLENFRNPNAHNRDIMEHQKHLLVGIVGELKIDMMEYRGDREKEESYFPKIDTVQINSQSYTTSNLYSARKKIYKVGDSMEIVIYASCPPHQNLQYKYGIRGQWQSSNRFVIKFTEADIGKNDYILFVKSDARYHKKKDYDDACVLVSTVVPYD